MNNFFESALGLFWQVAILFVLMGVGAVLTKRRVIAKEGMKSFVDLLLYIVTPAIIINAFLNVEFSRQTITRLGLASLLAVASHVFGFLGSFLVTDKDTAKKSVYKFGSMFSNAGYMGLPLAFALYGASGVFYASAYVIVFNIIQWTYGISLFKGAGKSAAKVLINPGTIGVAIGLPLFLLGLALPDIIGTPIDLIASLNTPFAMLVTGYYLAKTDFKGAFSDKKMWFSITLKMIVMPGLSLLAFRNFISPGETLLAVAVMQAAAPTAVNTIILAAKFEGDADLALRQVTISTILAIIIMPLLIALTAL